MDSITQASLGAAVAHAAWHKPLGRKALLWGAFFGTLPDLDIVFFSFLDDVQQLYWHRGESHSIFFVLIGGALLGALLWRIRWKTKISPQRAMVGMVLLKSGSTFLHGRYRMIPVHCSSDPSALKKAVGRSMRYGPG